MDPLSDVLSMLKVDSTLSSHFYGRGAWAFRYPGYPHLKFGRVSHGTLHVWTPDRAAACESIELHAGDFYLLTQGHSYVTSSMRRGPHTEAPVIQDGVAMHVAARDTGVVSYGAGEPVVAVSSGRFTFTGEADRLLLRHLPPLIHLRSGDEGAKSLAALLELLQRETADLRPGAAIARTSLAALVLVQALRVYLGRAERSEGWLAAVVDPRIGRALAAIHAFPAHGWTVGSLARTAGMSRTTFADRFRDLAGTTPIDYLSGWRMTVARRALRASDDSISVIAERVGYFSEAAFSTAFRRINGRSPRRFRADDTSSAAGHG
ncbi:MAG: putative transcriptional regulator, AraC family [Rhizobacter sp.]|nr:putative transcriptional regulator, AraC family [Rhizobacter sp.]